MTRRLARILIAVDDSPSSDAAIEQGLAIAADADAQVIFAHAVPTLGEQFVPGDGFSSVFDSGLTIVTALTAGTTSSTSAPGGANHDG